MWLQKAKSAFTWRCLTAVPSTSLSPQCAVCCHYIRRQSTVNRIINVIVCSCMIAFCLRHIGWSRPYTDRHVVIKHELLTACWLPKMSSLIIWLSLVHAQMTQEALATTADGPRDALCQLKSGRLLHDCRNKLYNNSTRNRSDGVIEHFGRPTCIKWCASSHDTLTIVGVVNKLDRRRVLLITRWTCSGEIF